MTSTLDRLRRLNNLRPLRGAARDIVPDRNKRPLRRESGLQGQEIENAAGTCFVATYATPIHTERGSHPLNALLGHPPLTLGQHFPSFNLDHVENFHNSVFLDTETTGLGTGASVYAFMIGLGTFETLVVAEDAEKGDADAVSPEHEHAASAQPTHFVVRQFFMRDPTEELSLLHELATQIQEKQLVVTFNGRSFDLPLLRSRVRYNRTSLDETVLKAPLLSENAPHLDLLMPARRLWRRRLQSCRLSHLEGVILGLQRTEADVPGYRIPQMYADYVHTGDAREMERVFYHNREDIISMVSLATHLSLAFGRSRTQGPATTLHGKDWLSLAMEYERLNDLAQAEPAYRRALDANLDQADRAEIFQRLGRLQKRQGRWQEAADTWQLWLTSIPGNDPAPYVELAKYYEWQLQDFEQAAMWTAWALHNLQQEPSEFAWSRSISELEHRLQRIRRKQVRLTNPGLRKLCHKT